MHLLLRGTQQIASAMADGTKLSLTVDGKTAGDMTVLVRSHSPKATSAQTAKLWVNGELHTKEVTFSAGTMIPMSRLSPVEKVMGVRAPSGPNSHVIYIVSPDGLEMQRRSSGSQTSASPPLQRDAVVVVAALNAEETGPVRVYRNDVNWDSDGDGLGDNLERELQTCAAKSGTVTGVNCYELADARDTDGDGLWDGWEILGKVSQWYDNGVYQAEYLPLGAWGANPRHKDIFIEVDFRRLNLQENQSGLALKMSPDAARQMAAAYADAATTDPWLKLAHAVSVNNPDRLPGINLHFDTGVAPTDAADVTLFGNWGGYNPVNAVQDANGNWVPQRPEQVWKQQMSRGRWGVFHYVMGYPSGGGACGMGIACGFNFYSAGVASHEFGHTLGLDHNGPYGTHEPNCKPNYPSLMNYAYLGRGYLQFADGLNYPLLNNHALTETNGVNPSQTALMDVLESTYRYKVDRISGHVDWNRDGLYAPAGTTVRAYANYQPSNSCEFTREGQKASGLQSNRSPAVVYYAGRIYVFAVGLDGVLRFTYTQSPWTCSPTADHCPDPVFVEPFTMPLGHLVSVDAKPFLTSPGVERVVITGLRSDGTLVETVMFESAGWPVWGVTNVISGPSSAIGELSLATSENKSSLAMVYKGPDHTVRYRYRTTTGWSAEVQLQSGGQPIKMHANTSPGLAYTRLPLGITFGEKLVGAFADTSGYIHLYTPAFPGTGWSRISLSYETMYSTVGRPVLGWVGAPPTNAPAIGTGLSASMTANRFYIVYLEKQTHSNGTTTDVMRMMMSYVDTDGSLKIGLNAYFDNVWAFGFGMGFVQPSAAGLRAVFTSAIPNSMHGVYFRPHADGIADLAYRNYDDWKTLGWASCATLVPTQTSAPIVCAPAW
jgi:hypothetical protein